MKRAILVVASIAILLVTAWWTLALVFAGPEPAWLRTGLAAVYALGTLAILLWLPTFTGSTLHRSSPGRLLLDYLRHRALKKSRQSYSGTRRR